ncbi:DUF3841 domain-containing protein [Lactobacillus sp. CC-MHH1034]|uniref:DUF3841 domain-containing protein n=1 Tax=Agrilactobacillus fermenti TaxID=2586909 RepID=UPI001E3821EE|nr:DUF3841 domain-containing protein [Agrilactobacillus fermenti]MCD2255154.1 DUF3841 domain-containing protein [Agrilactobacillus fermenti]
MILWTNQPFVVYQQLQQRGIFSCDPAYAPLLADDNVNFKNAYQWMCTQLKQKVGLPPAGVEFPIWAWYRRNYAHQRPDFRQRQDYDDQVLLELMIPETDVLLSDFDQWHFVLGNSYLPTANSEREFDQAEQRFENLSATEQQIEKLVSWQQIFDITPRFGDWTQNGAYVQGCFWQLKQEQVCRAWRRQKGHKVEELFY